MTQTGLSFLVSFHKYLFRAYDIPGPIPGAVNMEVNQEVSALLLWAYILVEHDKSQNK